MKLSPAAKTMDPRMLSRPAARLTLKLDNALAAYAAIAGAGVCALTSPAEARVVFTPMHQVVSPNTTLKIDLNNDGIFDFSITNSNFHQSGSFSHTNGYVTVKGLNFQNVFSGYSGSFPFIQPLAAGIRVPRQSALPFDYD